MGGDSRYLATNPSNLVKHVILKFPFPLFHRKIWFPFPLCHRKILFLHSKFENFSKSISCAIFYFCVVRGNYNITIQNPRQTTIHLLYAILRSMIFFVCFQQNVLIHRDTSIFILCFSVTIFWDHWMWVLQWRLLRALNIWSDGDRFPFYKFFYNLTRIYIYLFTFT